MNIPSDPKPLIAITMGDPTGVGPEIIVKALSEGTFADTCSVFAIGRPKIFELAAQRSNIRVTIQTANSIDQVREQLFETAVLMSTNSSNKAQSIICLSAGNDEADEAFEPTIDARGGQAAYDCLISAAQLALSKSVDAIVTAPLHKVALKQAGHDWPGHTELLAHLCRASETAMMLYLPPGKPRHGGPAGFGVVHVTLHMAMREIFEVIDEKSIGEKIVLAHEFFSRIRRAMHLPTPPAIAVAALNPHCGELGRFGDEEIRIIRPAVEAAKRAGMRVDGPLSVDTLMPQAVDGGYDAVVAMYHDQGHIALKLLDMFDSVNVTLGLPIIRTSVAHGTAHDIAWQNRAHSSGMTQAIITAARLSSSRIGND